MSAPEPSGIAVDMEAVRAIVDEYAAGSFRIADCEHMTADIATIIRAHVAAERARGEQELRRLAGEAEATHQREIAANLAELDAVWPKAWKEAHSALSAQRLDVAARLMAADYLGCDSDGPYRRSPDYIYPCAEYVSHAAALIAANAAFDAKEKGKEGERQ